MTPNATPTAKPSDRMILIFGVAVHSRKEYVRGSDHTKTIEGFSAFSKEA